MKDSGGPVLGIRARVVTLIFVMQAAMIWWVADSEIARGIYLICYSLMMPTALYLLLTRVLRRWMPFEDRELLFGYIVLTCTLPVIGFGGLRFIIAGSGYIRFFSKFQPQWAKYLPYLDRLPGIKGEQAIKELYLSGTAVPWDAWVVPIAYWSLHLLLLAGVWLCMAGILRRVWIHQERLPFPIAVLPLQLSDPREDIFRRPLLWMGFAIPAVMQSLLVFHMWWPAVPAFQLKASYYSFANPPWNAIPGFAVGFYPMAVGLAYFIPSSVSFSCWFLALAMKMVFVIGGILGISGAGAASSRFPYVEEQAAGAWLALAGLILWGARRQWRTVAKLVPADELRTVRRFAVLAAGLALASAGLMSAIGVPPLMALGAVAVYMAYVLAGARVRAEAGGQWTFSPVVYTPQRTVYSAFGSGGLDPGVLAAGGFVHLADVDIRAQSLPYLMEGMEIAERSGIRWRTVLVWVAIGTVTALALGWAASLSKYYQVGAATAHADKYALVKARLAFEEADSAERGTIGKDPAGIVAIILAGLFTLLLAYTRRVGVLGLHPVGYVLCNTIIMNAFIVPFFLAWLAKTCMLRFGGSRAYRASVPFFVGITLGDVVIQGFWALVGWAFNVPIYQFLT